MESADVRVDVRAVLRVEVPAAGCQVADAHAADVHVVDAHAVDAHAVDAVEARAGARADVLAQAGALYFASWGPRRSC